MNSIKPISESNDPLQRRGARRAGWVFRHLHYDPLLKERAKQLRNHMTLAEVLLWNELKNKQVFGYDFDRQRPIAHYIVDFFCKKLNLAVEIDGQSHNFRATQDTERQKQIEVMGIRFMRFWDYDVKHDINSVLKRIRDWILEEELTRPGLRPPLPRRGPKYEATNIKFSQQNLKSEKSKIGNPKSKIEQC